MKKKKLNNRLKRISFITSLFVVSANMGYGIDVVEDFVNEGSILVTEGNGIDLKREGINITNSGTISSVTSSNVSPGNGISSTSTIGTITNSGNIFGSAVVDSDAIGVSSANGISSYSNGSSSTIGTIVNSGNISGNVVIYSGVIGASSGNGISSDSFKNINTSTIGNLINSGNIFGNTVALNGSTMESNSGNGISSYSISVIGNITNSGNIFGNTVISDGGFGRSTVGNGISSDSLRGGSSSSIKNITNSGNISGNVVNSGGSILDKNSGNGISSYSFRSNSSIGNVTNSGNISGNVVNSDGSILDKNSGNGISSYSFNNISNSTIGNIINSGNISGNVVDSNGNILDKNSGNGISSDSLSGKTIGNIINSGLIKGSNQAIKGDFSSLNNYGILVGETIVDLGANLNNNGIMITLKTDNSGEISTIGNGTGGEVTLADGNKKTVMNGTVTGKDSSLLSSDLTGVDNLIINGAGVDKGALVIDQNTTLTGSIVNGYNTAVYLEGTNKLTATDTIFNGGGFKNDIAVIKGNSGDNEISLNGTSIINGSVNLGDGNDTLLLDNTTQINGVLNGGLGNNDTLGLGQNITTKTTTNLNILHNISGFETINTNGNVTLFETVKITDADSINLESGNLTLRVDPTKVDTDGKVTGHALYENTGTLNSTGGNLVIGLNGLGKNAIVSMGGTTITQNTNDSWWKDSDHLTTNSLVLDAKLSADGKDVTITVKESLPLGPSTPVIPLIPLEPSTPVIPLIPLEPSTPIVNAELYNKLNEVYKSIVSSGEIGVLAKTTLIDFVAGDSYLETVNGSTGKTFEESLGGLLTVLDQIYANNPYAYTLKSSRDSLKLFEDNMSYLTIKPEAKEWLVQGRAIYTGVKNDNESSGKNYYGFDTGHRNYNTTTNTIGGLATLEYGLSDKTSLGLVLGGNNQHINFKGTSKIDGNSLYVGTFIKTEINKFKLMSGLSYQYTSATAERGVSNEYDSFRTSDKYDINSFNTFVEAKYLLASDKQWKVEPKIRLSYYYVSQDRVNEGYTPSQLSIEVDKANNNTADVEIGLDFTKEILLSRGKLNNIISVGVINTLGNKEKSLEGNIIGKDRNGSKFEIKGIELPTTTGKISYDLEYEQINGMIYSAGVDFEFAKDYNRNINVTLGMGYKF